MDQQHYKAVKTHAPHGTVTQGHWCSGGMKSSSDNYTSYTISAFQHWYLYKFKPKWFGQHEGDRYLGRLRWISRHCDGRQARNVGRRGDLDGYKVVAATEKDADNIARSLAIARGYIMAWQPDNSSRERHLRMNYHLGIRCAECGAVCAQVKKARRDRSWALRYQDRTLRQFMDSWMADQQARVEVGCKCYSEFYTLHANWEGGNQ